MKKHFAIAALLWMVASSVQARKSLVPEDIERRDAVTVFVEATVLGKHQHMAKKINEVHDDFAKHGFELVDVSVYTENSDLEGIFVSYKRKK